MAIDGRKQQLFLERVVLKALRLMVSGGLGKSSLHCVYSPPLEVEVWDYGRRCTFYHDTHLRSSELWFISKMCWTHWLYATP